MKLYVDQLFDAKSSHDQVVAFMQSRLVEEDLTASTYGISRLGVGQFFPREYAYILQANDSLEALAIEYADATWEYFLPHTDEESFYNSLVNMRPYDGYSNELYAGLQLTPMQLLTYSYTGEVAFARVESYGEDLQKFVNVRRLA